MDSAYARQQPLNLNIPHSVAVVGCGGVGHWVAYILAMTGVPRLVLYDPDVVSETNYNRIMATIEDLGKPKVNLLKEIILKIRPECEVIAINQKFNTKVLEYSFSLRTTYIVAATDTIASRREIYTWASKTNSFYSFYIEAAAEGEIGSIATSPAEFTTPEEEQPGYRSVPVWIGPCITAAYLTVNQIVHRSNATIARLGWDRKEISFLTKTDKEEF